MASFMSHVLVAVLRLQDRRRRFEDPRVLRDEIERERRTVKPDPPRALSSRCRVEPREIAGARCFTLSPLGAAGEGLHILYLHGGCYVFEIDPYHWAFCASLVERLGCTVTVPIYPLAPEHDVGEIVPAMTRVYREIAGAAGRMILMGDSAGGGMALAVAHQLRDEGLARDAAAQIVLLSPWLDIAMDNPDIAEVEARDPWLAPPGMIEAGRLYARGVDPKDPRVSPLHGKLEGLGALSIFIGTRDVLLPDSRRFAARAKEAGIAVRLFEYEGMVHDFMLVSLLPEAKRALADIASVLQGL